MALLAAAWGLAGPASAHVFLRADEVAYSDAPFEITIHHVDVCGQAGPLSSDHEHADVVGPDADGVFQVRWGVPAGIGCTEDPPMSEVVTPARLGPVPAGPYRVEVRDEIDGRLIAQLAVEVYDRPACVSSDASLCLHRGRFGVTTSWQDFAGNPGVGHAVPRDVERPFLADSGLLWFFQPDNYELVVKVLDGCALNGHFWVFVSSASTVEYTIEVTDHATGARHGYRNALGAVPDLVADTSAFPCD